MDGESDSETDSIHDQFDDDDDDDDNDDEGYDITAEDANEDENDPYNGSDSRSELSISDDGDGKRTRLKLREILFFTEKVEIFKVRHGTL